MGSEAVGTLVTKMLMPKRVTPPTPTLDHSKLDPNEYRLIVERLLKDTRRDPGGEPHVFGNHGPEYAHAVMDALIDNAQNEVLIFAKELSNEVYDAARIKTFLQRSAHPVCHIVVEADKPAESMTSALHDLTSEIERGLIRVSVIHDHPTDHNFAVVDGSHLRLETSQVNREATIVLRHPDLASRAKAHFEELEKAASTQEAAHGRLRPSSI